MSQSAGLITPSPLKSGDTVGIVSPSAGLAPFVSHRVQRAESALKKLGLKIRYGQHALENHGHTSATIEERVQDLHDLFSDPSVKMIMASIGGNHSNKLLSLLDYSLIKNNPKIFIGFSDITVLHFALQKKSQLMTYHGPMFLTQMAENPEPLSFTLESFNKVCFSAWEKIEIKPSNYWTDEVLDWFEKKDHERPRKLHANSGFEWLKRGSASGVSWGGAVVSLNHLAGTEYWIDPQGCIAFLDIPEGPDIHHGLSIADIDAYFADYQNLGVFRNIAGLIIGRPYNYNPEQTQQLKQLIMEYTEEQNYPILFGADIGHTDPIITLPYGCSIELDSERNFFGLSLK